ncbi:hypothetical protein LUQ84_000763 [Hamiltosporidium tvaerminnensis]|nr:hypothetical protein LUQ84_000763 [Hamiltosporidium tvaerminnensis]
MSFGTLLITTNSEPIYVKNKDDINISLIIDFVDSMISVANQFYEDEFFYSEGACVISCFQCPGITKIIWVGNEKKDLKKIYERYRIAKIYNDLELLNEIEC